MKNLLKALFVALSVTTAMVNVASASSGSAAEEAAAGGGEAPPYSKWSLRTYDTYHVLSFLPPEDRARFGAVSRDTRRQLITYRKGGAEIAHTVERYLRYVILGEGATPTAIEMSILRRDPEFTARRILIEIRDTMTDDKRICEIDSDLGTVRAYLRGSALTPDYIQRRVLDAIPRVNNDILEHIKHRVIISCDDTLTDAEVRAFYDEYQTLDEALLAGAVVKRFAVAPHDNGLLRELNLPYFDAHPEVTLVVSFDGEAVPDEWRVSRNVRRLAIIGSNVERIGNNFLGFCEGLTSLDLSPLARVTSIGSDFLRNCRSLTALDLRPLANVTRIRNAFLAGCRGLTSLDLSPLARVTSIESGFLLGCRGLTALDLSPLANVTSVGGMFLSRCYGLSGLDLSPLANVTEIGNNFLESCSGLTVLDLSRLANVTSIGYSFLSNCEGLTALDLSPLARVTSIDCDFLNGCGGIRELDLSPLARVTSIGSGFLFGCGGIRELDLSPLANVTRIGYCFLCACRGIRELDLSPLARVTRIDGSFLMYCRALESINIKGLNPTIKADIREQLRSRGAIRLRIIE